MNRSHGGSGGRPNANTGHRNLLAMNIAHGSDSPNFNDPVVTRAGFTYSITLESCFNIINITDSGRVIEPECEVFRRVG